MILHFAVSGNLGPNINLLGYKHLLFSYFYFNPTKKKAFECYKELVDSGSEVFMDSGAFSAFTQNKEISLVEYEKFIEKYKPEMYAALDVIGDSIMSRKNYDIMVKDGFSPLPVFHTGDPIEDLLYYIDKTDYIALGGMVGYKNLIPWLNKVWSIILKNKPELKVHGFGLTTPAVIKYYPFYSVDSSSWTGGIRYYELAIYHKKRMEFITQSCRDYHIKNQEFHWDGQKMSKEAQLYFTKIQMEEYIKMIKHVNEVHQNIDFSYLTNQTQLF